MSGGSLEENDAEAVRVRMLNKDGAVHESRVDVVEAEAEIVEENDSEMGRVPLGAEKTVDARASKVSVVGSITYVVMIWGGRGCNGGIGGMGNLITGPKVTCRK